MLFLPLPLTLGTFLFPLTSQFVLGSTVTRGDAYMRVNPTPK